MAGFTEQVHTFVHTSFSYRVNKHKPVGEDMLGMGSQAATCLTRGYEICIAFRKLQSTEHFC